MDVRRRGQPRIIPADAGSTWGKSHLYWLRRDHPRGCGEHMRAALIRLVRMGSSPRMRGARDVAQQLPAPVGIIPADAGSTSRPVRSIFRKRDHPRGCGEHTGWPGGLRLVGGSSPRMRGAPGHHQRPALRAGIIPADAGSTACLAWSFAMTEDHPRGCGEHTAFLTASSGP